MFNDHSILNLLLSVSEKDFENRSIFDDVMTKNRCNFYWPTLYLCHCPVWVSGPKSGIIVE